MRPPGYILTLCTANICRSPMAAGLLEHALAAESEPLKSLRVVSAGVAGQGGERVSENSVLALKRVGIDISRHTSQPLTRDLVRNALAIFGMTESHRALVSLQFDPPPRHLYLFREFLPGNVEKEISDPFGSPLRVYEACRDEMVEAVPSLIAFLKTLVRKE